MPQPQKNVHGYKQHFPCFAGSDGLCGTSLWTPRLQCGGIAEWTDKGVGSGGLPGA